MSTSRPRYTGAHWVPVLSKEGDPSQLAQFNTAEGEDRPAVLDGLPDTTRLMWLWLGEAPDERTLYMQGPPQTLPR